jgi:TonB-dependent Receptor Plug Domain
VRRVVAIALVLLPAAAVTLGAQVPVRPAGDTGAAAIDSLADSLRRRIDTVSSTDRLLQAAQQEQVVLKPLPLVGDRSLQPIGARIVFSRDSIDWAPAETLSELLALVPGVHLWRGGWWGRPELPDYEGRGAGSVLYYLDGMPRLPLGPDSLTFDPSTFPLGILDRVEVERDPGLLRVYLFTRRHDREAPRTKIGVATGDRGLSRYFGSYEHRYRSGLGLAMAADYFGVNAPTGGTGGSHITTGWVQLGYNFSPRLGLQAQLITAAMTRDALLTDPGGDTLAVPLQGTRTDVDLRASWRTRSDGLGSQLDLFGVKSIWSGDTARHTITSFGGVYAYRRPTWSAELDAWSHSIWTTFESKMVVGWAPDRRVSGSLELDGQHHDGNRTSDWATARIGVRLPYGLEVGGMWSDGHRVDAPALLDDAAHRFTDGEVHAGLHWNALDVTAGLARNDGWTAHAFPEFSVIASLAPLPRTDWVTVQARLSPTNWFSLETTYYEPRTILPDGMPPQHAISTATVRSKFLRNFPSGIFDLKVQAVVESWSPGVGGRDAQGNAITLPGATFIRGIFQLQLGPFIVYFDRVNFRATKTGYVPGYPVLSLGSSYGVRWEFAN